MSKVYANEGMMSEYNRLKVVEILRDCRMTIATCVNDKHRDLEKIDEAIKQLLKTEPEKKGMDMLQRKQLEKIYKTHYDIGYASAVSNMCAFLSNQKERTGY
jgi:hypothetical protein